MGVTCWTGCSALHANRLHLKLKMQALRPELFRETLENPARNSGSTPKPTSHGEPGEQKRFQDPAFHIELGSKNNLPHDGFSTAGQI